MTTIQETSLPNLFSRGKVRDTYDLGDGRLLMVATDRISAFDVVLPTPIPEKGVVLCLMSAFWFQKADHLVTNHLVALAQDAEATDSSLLPLPPEIARRAMVVKRAQRLDVECVVRGYITGSAWAEYSKHGTVSGQAMPSGLKDGDRLSEVLFTPTTKADVGHDENMSMKQVEDLVGVDVAQRLKEKSLEVYDWAHDYALDKGIIIADTKMEFGLLDGEVILIDELLTPDSSRFWDRKLYAPGRSQVSFDKQYVRDWLTEAGWNREPPAPELPPDVVLKTRERYLEALHRLTGASL